MADDAAEPALISRTLHAYETGIDFGDALHAAQTLVAAKAQWDGIESARVAHNQALDQVGLGELRVSGAFNDVVAAFEGKSEDHVRAGLTQLLNTMASLRGRVPAVAMLSPKGPKKR